jgi:BTB/POZ domain
LIEPYFKDVSTSNGWQTHQQPEKVKVTLDFQEIPKYFWDSPKLGHFYKISVTTENVALYSSHSNIMNQPTFNQTFQLSREAIKENLSKSGSCHLKFHVEISSVEQISRDVVHDNFDIRKKILQSVGELLYDPTFADFTFDVKGKEFKVHKVVLASASPVMRTLFTSKMKEGETNFCEVNDIEPEVFESLLQFIYSGKIPENIKHSCFELYESSHYYKIDELLTLCEQEIHSKLSVDNAVETYSWAAPYDIKELKMEAWKMIK